MSIDLNIITLKTILDEAIKVIRPKSNNIIKMGRVKLVRLRIRAGKVQKRVKVSTIKGFTFRNGKLVRITALEKRRRLMGARRGRFKRKAKIARTKLKIRKSILRRKSFGIR